MLTRHPSQQDTIPLTVSVNQGWVFLLPLYYLISMSSFCVCVCVYLSDGLWDPVAAAGVCEANGCVHADLVANRHINRLRTPVRASQCLNTKTDVFISAHFSLWLLLANTVWKVWQSLKFQRRCPFSRAVTTTPLLTLFVSIFSVYPLAHHSEHFAWGCCEWEAVSSFLQCSYL